MSVEAPARPAFLWRMPRAELLADLCLVGSWLWLIRPSLAWIVDNLTRLSGRLSLLLVVAITGLAVVKTRGRLRAGPRPRLRLAPSILPMLLFVTGGLAFVACERLVGVNHLSLVAAGLGTYGLVGLYLPPGLWRRGCVPGLLLLVVMPMAEQIDVYLGFPARVMTADIVHQALAGLVPQDVTAQTILVFEGGAAQVDLPCSGVKSLWAGAVLSLAATWLDTRRLGWQWLLCNAVFVALLLAVNVMRVLALVVVGIVLARPDAAELMHVSLGLIGFALSAAALLALYRWLVPPSRATSYPWHPPRAAPWQLRLLLVTLTVLLIAAWAPRPAPAAMAEEVTLELPAGMVAEPLSLTRLEQEHFGEQGAAHAAKLRFTWRDTTGSLILVLSESFRAHHLPDRCIGGSGLTIEGRRTHLVDASRPITRVELLDHAGEAAYWFQAAGRTTEDYSARVWADVSGSERRWVLVSVLLDGQPGDATELFGLIHDAVDASYFGGTP